MLNSNDGNRAPTNVRNGIQGNMRVGFPRAMRGAVSVTQIAVAVVLIALAAFAAWWFLGSGGGGLPSITPGASTTKTAPDASTAAAPAAAEDLSVNELYKEARAAMGANRMVAPAGNNALEYYLRILAKTPDDTSAADALRELFPFATGSAEDQINQGNFDEANRIMGLLAKADPSNYTLTILRSKLDAKKKQNDKEQLQAQQAAATAAAAAAAKTQGATASAAPSPAAADSAAAPAAAEAPAATPKQSVARATPAPSAAPAAPSAPEQPVGETRDVRVVSPPRPSYPATAARNRQEGWVEVEFTVAADGSVQNAKVVTSNPSRVFDREAVHAIETAKFEPRLDKGQAVATTMRRRIEFKLGQ